MRGRRAQHARQPVDALHVVVGLVSTHSDEHVVGEGVGPLLEALQLRSALLGQSRG